MVYQTPQFTDRPPQDCQGHERCSLQPPVRQCPPSEPQITTNGMQSIRSNLINSSISPEITNIIMNSWTPGTHKQYNVYLNKWTQFCLEGEINTMQPNVNDVLKFFHSLYNKELSYSTINTARSALSNYLMGAVFSGTNYTMINHHFIVRYMKGVFNSRKPSPKYSETWDVNVVLNYMALLYPLDKLLLKEHSLKLVVLLALTSGQRRQTLTFLDITSMKKTQDYFIFHLNEHIKQSRKGHVFSTFYVRKYQQPELCAYRTLENYLERTLPLRSSTGTKLLLSYVKPFSPVGVGTVGRWIKTLLGLSGIDTTIFKAHSTRSACVSKASQVAPADTILKHVGWASDSTFRKFYNKPIVCNDLFENTVLE